MSTLVCVQTTNCDFRYFLKDTFTLTLSTMPYMKYKLLLITKYHLYLALLSVRTKAPVLALVLFRPLRFCSG